MPPSPAPAHSSTEQRRLERWAIRHEPSSEKCLQCPVAAVCVLNPQQHSVHRIRLQPQQNLVAQGEAASRLYCVRSGSLKSSAVDLDGQERIRAFHLPGDIVGLEAIGACRYSAATQAIASSELCALDMRSLSAALDCGGAFAHSLTLRLGRALSEVYALSGDYCVDARMAALLLTMEQRLAPSPSAQFLLPMSRRDLANYLRLAPETASRCLHRFAREQRIALQGRRVRIIERTAMHALAAPMLEQTTGSTMRSAA